MCFVYILFAEKSPWLFTQSYVENLQSNLKFSRFVEYFPVTISVQISHIAPKYVCVCVHIFMNILS